MTKLIFYFLLRNRVKYEIIILLFLAVYNFIQNDPSQYGLTYSGTLSGILYIVYSNVLNRHKGRINILYSGNTIKQFKSDVIKAISILSLSLLLIAILLDIFLLHAFHLSMYHIVTLVVFIFSTSLITINIEKKDRQSDKIITFKEGIKAFLLGIGLNIVPAVLLQFF